jgi:hypothetical protein
MQYMLRFLATTIASLIVTNAWAEDTHRNDPSTPITGTFSIAAFDPATKELGVVVQSKVVAVGARVPWFQAGVVAIATQ